MNNNSIMSQMPPVTKNLILVNILIWAAMAIFPNEIGEKLNQYCGLHYILSDNFIGTQLITYQFIHGGFTHLFFNMFTLFMFGMVIENVFGAKRFILYYLTCGVGAGIIQEIAYYIDIQMLLQENVDRIMPLANMSADAIRTHLIHDASYTYLINSLLTVGASGAVYGILLAFGMFFPNRQMFIMFIPYPVKAKWVIIGYAVLELSLGLGNAQTGIAHFAHLGGMIFGFLLILYWRKTGIIRKNGGYF